MATLLNDTTDIGSKLAFARAELLDEYRAAHDCPWINPTRRMGCSPHVWSF